MCARELCFPQKISRGYMETYPNFPFLYLGELLYFLWFLVSIFNYSFFAVAACFYWQALFIIHGEHCQVFALKIKMKKEPRAFCYGISLLLRGSSCYFCRILPDVHFYVDMKNIISFIDSPFSSYFIT